MSAESESFLTRWSRRKRAVEREAVKPADNAAPKLPEPPVQVGAPAVAADAPIVASGSVCEPAATTELPLPPIESLDGLRSDYRAFFQQPVDNELRHAALKKLFADPHFNQMDMLDVYVDDYTQFEPLPAALRLRLPSARAFLLDSELAELDTPVAATDAAGEAPGSPVVDPGPGCEAAGAAGEDGAARDVGEVARIDSTSATLTAGSSAPAPAADANRPGLSSPPAVTGRPGESDSSTH